MNSPLCIQNKHVYSYQLLHSVESYAHIVVGNIEVQKVLFKHDELDIL